MLKIDIKSQPDDSTCGPTSLHAIYRYYHFEIPLEKIIQEIQRSDSGGTISPFLGIHALQNGFDATMFVSNMTVFDPTWFKKSKAPREALIFKLQAQDRYKVNRMLNVASKACQDFLNLGGTIRFKTVDVTLLKEYFDKKIPILTGLNATYLYRSARECYTSEGESFYDDVQGEPCGHFVVLFAYDPKTHHVSVADPYRESSLSEDNYYKVSRSRVINAIMLGAATFDSTLLIIEPKKEEAEKETKKVKPKK